MNDLHKDREAVLASGLFDADWYRERYPDVQMAAQEPIDHFLTLGTILDRDPGPEFSTQLYLHLHGRKKLAGRNALVFHLEQPEDSGVVDLVLRGAHQLAAQGQVSRARRLAAQILSDADQAALASLDMIEALSQGNYQGWTAVLNRYLAGFGQSPVKLKSAQQDVFPQLAPAVSHVPVAEGPLISVLMPVFNAAQTLEYAVRSILHQSWRNLELIAVDDASTDASWDILQRLAAQDGRVKPTRLPANSGPYVAKTIALGLARGKWTTGQDADDWSLPQRLEQHFAAAVAEDDPVSLTWGLRLTPDGTPSHIARMHVETSCDGFARRVPIGALFSTDFLRDKLGAWDCVRFGADTELLLRAAHVLGKPLVEKPLISMLCRDDTNSLSNDAVHGTRARNGGVSDSRRAYVAAIRSWLKTLAPDADVRLPFPHLPRKFPAPEPMLIADSTLETVVRASSKGYDAL